MISIVTDSNADVPAELAERYGLRVIPSILHVAGQSYRDNVDLSRAEFYARLPDWNPPPTTAAPASGEFEEIYRQCPPGEIVSIHIAAKLSAICNAARLGAEASGRAVTVVDSEQVSMGLGWQVLAAAEAAEAGQTLDAIVAAAASIRRRLRVMAVLDTLEYLRRGGRASNLTAVLGGLLQIKPLLEVAGGQVLSLARQRTRRKALSGLMALVEEFGPLERLAIMHAHCSEDARQLCDQLAARAAQPPLIIELTSVLGVHLGPGALGVAMVRAD